MKQINQQLTEDNEYLQSHVSDLNIIVSDLKSEVTTHINRERSLKKEIKQTKSDIERLRNES